MGARANGLGMVSSCLTDHWSVFNNIGGLADVKNPTLAATYIHHPGIAAFNNMAFIITQPLKLGAAGIGLYRFGDDLYNEQIITAGYANTFGIASLGIKANYIQYQAEGFGNKGVMSISFGGVVRITPKFIIGAHVINLTQPSIGEEEKLPTTFLLGIAYKAGESLFLTTEIEKDIDLEPIWKTGLEYVIHKYFYLRTGFNPQPQAAFFGFGYASKRPLQLDYAFTYSPLLGSKHQATVGYRLFKKEKQK